MLVISFLLMKTAGYIFFPWLSSDKFDNIKVSTQIVIKLVYVEILPLPPYKVRRSVHLK